MAGIGESRGKRLTGTSRSPFGRTLLACMLLAGMTGAACAEKGKAAAFSQQGDAYQFGNHSIVARWKITDGKLADMVLADQPNHQELPVTAPVELTMADGSKLGAAQLKVLSAPKASKLKANAKASRLAERSPGNVVEATFGDADGCFRIDWQWVQREGSDYLRAIVTITALKQDENIGKVALLQAQAADAEVVGVVPGSPIVAGHDYFGFEHPLSSSEVHGKQVKLWIERGLPLPKGQSITYSAVVGVTHDNQLRRDFLTYVERERAHPYRTFLHYNSWYDIGYFTPYTEAQALDRIHAFGEELKVKRGVTLDSYLFDDGWDDRSGSWHFSKDFPHGFLPLRDAAATYGAAPGMWLSPWGGYGKPKEERVKNGQAAGYEIIDGGLALSGPKYYQRFHDAVMELVKNDGINQFKFDGTGNADKVFPGSRFSSDFDAAIQLIDDLRVAKPDLYINLTTGTMASPFWLRYADSIWRDGEDDDLAGVGTKRERWITYRDRETYHNIVVKGPLYPLNSLMLHGIIYAKENRRLNADPGHDFANEVRSYFATGTQLQEMYITPDLLTQQDWDVLAESARWSRANAGVLKDVHWVGGDPGRLDVYGWAAWTPAKAIVTLRNPSDKPQLAVIDLARQLELPPGAAHRFSARSPWKEDAGKPAMSFDVDQPGTITLAPFQVLTLELTPDASH
ncbi:enterotoxin [Dyella japonica]|uniref:Enterotoxin n=1 Tax=Dyella japonica A8 TaxID=1217721 RepID=A0A075K009_9GAMM|nr:enterotoxin [Dyella japonica]AIF47539.1 enterotoxin [Dyella japonica A8]